MASKRSISSSASSSGSQPKQAKRQVSVATFQKWQSQQENEHETLTWLRCDKQQRYIERLWCETCRRFQDRIRGTKNLDYRLHQPEAEQCPCAVTSISCRCLYCVLSKRKPRIILSPRTLRLLRPYCHG